MQNSTLRQYSGYSSKDLKECVQILLDLYMRRRGVSLHAVREKYKQHKVYLLHKGLRDLMNTNIGINEIMTCAKFSFEQFKCAATMASSPEIPDSYFEEV